MQYHKLGSLRKGVKSVGSLQWAVCKGSIGFGVMARSMTFNW